MITVTIPPAEQDVDFRLQAFLTMLFAVPIKSGRELKMIGS
jgi:hypothetical protein